ncbi:hypothetical protein SVAN01_11430 [Stagonosporopsis vannaccii]|nr:hypothetical protein SVAN01_11430 [Stagonosporopsis vannaccii]
MYFVAYVEDLERRLSSARKGTESVLSPQQHHSPAPNHGEVIVTGQRTAVDQVTGTMKSPFDSQPAMSSSYEFGSKIKNLPADSKLPALVHPSMAPGDQKDDVYNLEHENTICQQNRVADIQWPSEEEAHALLQTVVGSIGSVQHLIDPRAFSDNLSIFYDHDQTANPVIRLQHVEMLMVFALGNLLQGKLSGESSFPGATYFLNAVNHLPSLCTLRRAGTLAIETMGLFAFFLQCSDRKDDAYAYAGVALRLGIMNRLSQSAEKNALKRSEKTHRNRLWWTIYMQERRLAAATGNPVGVLDESITTEPPTDAAGFPPVIALDANSMILATRPVLLHLTKAKLECNDLGVAFAETPTLKKLVTYCIDAAGTSLDILHALKRQHLIARFGFFDLDAAVSSAFVFLLVESTHSAGSTQSGTQGIAAAVDILSFLSENGNKAAERRLRDVQHLCDHLGIILDEPKPTTGLRVTEVAPTHLHHSALATVLNTTSTNDQLVSSDYNTLDETAESFIDFNWRQALVSLEGPNESVNGLSSGNNTIWDGPDGFNFEFTSDFMLTEADVDAWEQFERQTTRNLQ